MTAVLPRHPSDIVELHPSPLPAEHSQGVSHIELHSPWFAYGCNIAAFCSSLHSNGISQPDSSSPSDRRSCVPQGRISPPSFLSQSRCRPTCAVSHHGMITVVDYSPSEGEANCLITVNIEVHTDPEDDKNPFGKAAPFNSMKLRLVVGRLPVRTTVTRRSPTVPHNEGVENVHDDCLRFRLHANAPSHSEVWYPTSIHVPLTIQAMDDATAVVDSVTFGSFTFSTPTTIEPTATIDTYKFPLQPSVPQNKRKREDDAEGEMRVRPDCPATLDSPKKALNGGSPGDKAFRLVRTTNAPVEALEDADTQPAALEWVVSDNSQHPRTLDKNWSGHELAVGRRLIRFSREQVGHRLLLSCEVISQEEYDELDIVISCVYRQETRDCWFTSVDVIYLLERLLGGPFSVEEKNRIRRNLEGFKPTTVSKSKAGFEMFFSRIMDFPPPKPRNIEKDVKVFAWSLLSPALEKIISKYSVIPEAFHDSSPPLGTPPLPASPPSDRVTRQGRTRSSSSASQVFKGEPIIPKAAQTGPSQPALHLIVDSPQPMHSETSVLIPDPDPTPVSMDQFYYSQAPDLSFPNGDQWQRRDSLASIASTSTRADDGFQDVGSHQGDHTPEQLQVHAFSNPFASDVQFGAMSLNPHGTGASFDGSENAHGGTDMHIPSAHLMRFGSNLTDDVFADRRPNLQNDLLYSFPGISSSGNHDTIVATYGTGVTDSHNVPHDLLYTQLSGGSIHHPSLEDIHA